MEKTNKTIASYLDTLDSDTRRTMKTLDDLIGKIFHDKELYLWEGIFLGGTTQTIIGYTEQLRSDKKLVEWFIIGLAKQKNYYSLYINVANQNGYLVKEYAEKLGKVKIGSSNFTFKKLEDIDLAVLTDLLIEAYNLTYNKI